MPLWFPVLTFVGIGSLALAVTMTLSARAWRRFLPESLAEQWPTWTAMFLLPETAVLLVLLVLLNSGSSVAH